MAGFTEQIVKHRTEYKDILIKVVTVFIACLLTIYSMEFFAFLKLRYLIYFIVVVAWYVAYRIVISRRVEYEYTIMDRDFFIDRIRGKRKRKTVVTIDFNKIDICAAVSDTERSRGRKKVSELAERYDCTGDGKAGVYFIEYENEKGTVRVLIQPKKEILEGLVELNPRKVFIYNE